MQEGVVVIMRFNGSPFASFGSLLEGLAPMRLVSKMLAGTCPQGDRVDYGRGGMAQPPDVGSAPNASVAGAAPAAGEPPAADPTPASGGTGLVRAIEEALARQQARP